MKLFRIFLYVGPTALFLLLSATPAAAQFEVSPDHFDNPPESAPKKQAVVVKKQSTTAQPGVQAKVKAQAGTTEKLHVTAKTNHDPGSAAKKSASRRKTGGSQRLVSRRTRRPEPFYPDAHKTGARRGPEPMASSGENASVLR